MIIKEQALKIVSDLIDSHKISGREAISLISAILNDSHTQCEVNDLVIHPHQETITTTVTGNITDNIITTSPKGMEIIYG